MPIWDINFQMRVDFGNPEVAMTSARIQAIARAIRGIPLTPQVQKKVDNLNILRAIRGTTAIEGNTLDEKEIERLITLPQPGPEIKIAKEAREVINASVAMQYITRTLNTYPDKPLDQDTIRLLHRLVTEGVDYPNNVPGQYRSHPVNAGRYIPPRTEGEVRDYMEQFERWLRDTAGRTDPVVRAIAAHFFFISIHPFGDGNGRTARAIESYLLYQGRINARGFYSLANFYYKNREEYVAQLDNVRFHTNGDLTPFVLFALRGLDDELCRLHDEVIAETRRTAFRDYARDLLLVERKLRSKNGERMISLVSGLSKDAEGVLLEDLMARRHPAAGLYATATNKTITRDINYLKKARLITVEGGRLKANLDIMTQYTASQANPAE